MRFIFLIGTILCAGVVQGASKRQQAKNMFDSLTGVMPTPAKLNELEALMDGAAGALGVAERITLEENFLQKVRDFATPFSNEEMATDFPLTDMSATIAGYVRDNRDFRGILFDDFIYVPGAGLTQYDYTSNQAYIDFENGFNQLSDPLQLVGQVQSTTTGLGVAAGVLTTRGFGDAYLKAGTNRAAVRFTYIHFLCQDMEALFDNKISDRWVRRDVERRPGGEDQVYINTCKGCHSGMDPQSSAFAYLDFIPVNANNPNQGERTVYSPGQVVEKVIQAGDTSPGGFQNTNDSWTQEWMGNAAMGWDPNQASGSGPTSWGTMIASSRQFQTCMSERVFESTCGRNAVSNIDKATVSDLARGFVESGFNMRLMFAQSAVSCMDD